MPPQRIGWALRVAPWASLILPYTIRHYLEFSFSDYVPYTVIVAVVIAAIVELTVVTLLLLIPRKWKLYGDDLEHTKLETLADLLWRGDYKHYGITTVVLFVLSWTLCYIPSVEDDIEALRRCVAAARLIVPVIMLIITLSTKTLSDEAVLLGIVPNFWLIFMTFASFWHLAVSCSGSWDRATRRPTFRGERRPLTRTNPAFNQSFGYVMRTPDATQRFSQHHEMRQRISRSHHSSPRHAVWHHPPGVIDASDTISRERLASTSLQSLWSWLLGTNTSEQFSHVDHEESGISAIRKDLFFQCYCCLDSPPTLTPETPRQLSQQKAWKLQRDSVLSLPFRFPSNQISQPRADDQTQDHGTVSLNHLCPSCDKVCGRSELLKCMDGLNFAEFLRHVFRALPLIEELFEHCSSFSQLQASAKDGCHLCSLILHSLSREQRDCLLEREAEIVFLLREAEDDSDEETLLERNTRLQNDRKIFVKLILPRYMPGNASSTHADTSLYLIPHFGYGQVPRRWLRQRDVERAQSLRKDPAQQWSLEQIAPVEIRRTVPHHNQGPFSLGIEDSTASKSSIDFIRSWLHQHEQQCTPRSTLNMQQWPSRLIDLGKMEDLNDLNVDLDVIDELFPTVRVKPLTDNATFPDYVALSYCWRANETNILTTRSFVDGDISVSDLAPTIQDAIKITRRLGFQFLWVDALCILQDSVADKSREIPRMAMIYSNATLVLAAVAANDSSETIICEQNPLVMTPCLLAAYSGLDPVSGIYAVPSSKYTSDALDDIRNCRLRSRAWVFQEERLAQRLAYFTTNQVILHCNICNSTVRQADWETHVDWEQDCIPDTVRPSLMTWPSNGKDQRKRTLQHLDVAFFSTVVESTHELQTKVWFGLVEQYTRCFLTQQTDRLPAIRGLATRLEIESLDTATPNLKYHIGLFDSEESRVASLLWYVSDNQAKRPSHRVPSWTWGSVEGTIKNNSTMCNFGPRESGVVVSSLENSDGRLRVEAKIRLGLLKPMPEESPRFYVGHHESVGIDDPFYHEQFMPVRSDPNAGPEVQALCEFDGKPVGYFIPDAIEELPSGRGQLLLDSQTPVSEIYCLRIVVRPMTTTGEANFGEPWATRGLALVRCDTEDVTYRRVGYIELSREHESMEHSLLHPDLARNRQSRAFPDIDKHGFFKSVGTNVVIIV